MGSIGYEILDASQFCCVVINSDCNVIYANKKSVETFGDRIVGVSIDRLSPKSQSSGQLSAEAMRAHLTMAAAVGKRRFAWEACDLDGIPLPHPFEVDCAALDVDGEACMVLFYNVLGHNCVGCENLKERKVIEERVKGITEHMPIACKTFDGEFNLVDCNRAAVALYGMKDKQEMLQKFAQNIPEFQPDGMASPVKAKQLIGRAFEEGVIVFEWMNKNLAGDLLPTEVTLLRTEMRGEYYVMAFQRDLRDFYKYKETEYTLMQRLEAMLNSSPLLCTIIDENGNVTAANRKAEALFEIPDKQIYIDNFYDFSPTYQPDGVLSTEKAAEMLAQTHKNGHASFIWLHQTRDGKPIPAEIYLKQVVLEGRPQVISYTRDLR